MDLTRLSDDDLLTRLDSICFEGHRLTARLLVHLVEVEARRLDLRLGYSSLFDFCRRKLGMSDGEAFRRITAARLLGRLPRLLAPIEHGKGTLSTLVLLRDHLTDANLDELVAQTAGKTKMEVQELLARRAPRPDVPSTVRELPPLESAPMAATVLAPAQVPARIEPLAEERYEVRFTASRELRGKLERARDLMRHRNPSGDLAVVIERGVDALLAKLEKERLGRSVRPHRNPRRATKPRVTAAKRREVFARDGERCTFVSEDGQRCPSTTLLEIDHIEPRALGGGDEASNLRVLCRRHNRLRAEEVFGKEHVTACASSRHRESVDPDVELAKCGLVKMGFRDREARRALDVVVERHVADVTPLPVAEIVREALAVLT
jgi:hypothetical protein